MTIAKAGEKSPAFCMEAAPRPVAWHDPAERFYFRPEYIDELRALDTRHLPPAVPELALIAQGDEVLDWREMVARYPQAQQIVQEGGEHALLNFADYLPAVVAFLALA